MANTKTGTFTQMGANGGRKAAEFDFKYADKRYTTELWTAHDDEAFLMSLGNAAWLGYTQGLENGELESGDADAFAAFSPAYEAAYKEAYYATLRQLTIDEQKAHNN